MYAGCRKSYFSRPVAAQLDLGGGTRIQFGCGNSQNANDTDEDTWSLGLKMGF